jgi:uncharacterized Zn-binding protein involved in type VI secretion
VGGVAVSEKLIGRIVDFVPKEVGCTGKMHAFSGMVCACGAVRITSNKVLPGSKVEAVGRV